MDMQKEEGTENPVAEGALDALAVAPPPDPDAAKEGGTNEDQDDRSATRIRSGMDASDVKNLRRNPSDEDAKLEVALDETFPSSDAPSNTQPGKGKDPAPSSGYDEDAEAKR